MPTIEADYQGETAVSPGLRKAIEAIARAPYGGVLITDMDYQSPRELVLAAVYEELTSKEGDGDAYLDPMNRAEALLRFLEARMIGKVKDKVIWINPDLPGSLD